LGKDVMRAVSYNRHELLSSDHRPVSAVFEVHIKQIDKEKKFLVTKDIIKTLDRIENSRIPQCTVSSPVVQFDKVYVNQPKTQSIQLFNSTTLTVSFYLKNSIYNQNITSGLIINN
jgi:inositol polyphosphate 5-phosphatase INPP5B/F